MKSCRYNAMIKCPPKGRACAQCGWNPAVKEARVCEFLKKYDNRTEEAQKCAN